MRTRIGNVLVVLGTVLVAYALAVALWGDPLTDLYARWQQRQLAAELDRAFVAYAGRPTAGGGTAEAEERFRRGLRLGQPLGRIVVPRLGLDEAFVHGTRWGPDLSRGPGHYPETALPGSGRTVGLAGHRTTFGAPFRKIDELERGDEIVVLMPYGAFRYRVFAHEIVASDDWSILRRRRFETLVLSACHPLWSSSSGGSCTRGSYPSSVLGRVETTSQPLPRLALPGLESEGCCDFPAQPIPTPWAAGGCRPVRYDRSPLGRKGAPCSNASRREPARSSS